jgi:hypothetical protein
MLLIFSTPELIRNMWQLKTAVFLHWCLLPAAPFMPFIQIKQSSFKTQGLDGLGYVQT